MDKQKQLELLYEKLRAFKMMTLEARAYFQKEIDALVAEIKKLEE
jgi:hypothetical protein